MSRKHLYPPQYHTWHSEYYVWDTMKRVDLTPVPNVYHAVADASDVIVFDARVRPCLTLEDGVKMYEFPTHWLHPKLPVANTLPKWPAKGLMWRMAPQYDDPEEWLEEVAETGEAVCWLPEKKWVEYLVKAKFDVWFFVTFELKISSPVGLVTAAFKPRFIYYPYNDESDPVKLDKIHKYGVKMADRRLRVANTVVYKDNTRTSIIPLSSIPL